MRRPAVLAALVLALPVTASASGGASWAQPQIRTVLAAGLMSGGAAGFRAQDPLTYAELSRITARLAGGADVSTNDPSAVTLARLDAATVRAVGLGDAAHRFYLAARGAGLSPPPRFGTEAVARLLGFRLNHPAARDDLELQPGEPATRAEAAFTAARALELDEGTVEWVKATAAELILPQYTPWQRRVLSTAVRLIGYPYVWAGEDERTERGFDCSGFVWRVYKLQRYPGAETLPATLGGRTTYELSAEVRPAGRIPLDALRPGDVLFFGAHGPASRPGQVDHAGLFLGGGWMIHSSRFGVALAPLDGWYAERFAWARRPLAEAGLEPLD